MDGDGEREKNRNNPANPFLVSGLRRAVECSQEWKIQFSWETFPFIFYVRWKLLLSHLNFELFHSSFAPDDLLLSSELRWCEKDAHFFHDLHFPNHHLFLAIMTTPPHTAAARWSWKQKSWNEKFKQQKRRVERSGKSECWRLSRWILSSRISQLCMTWLEKKLQSLSQTLSSSSWTSQTRKETWDNVILILNLEPITTESQSKLQLDHCCITAADDDVSLYCSTQLPLIIV